MSDGRAALRALSMRLHALPKKLVADSAPEIAKEVERITKANIAAGQGPDGAAWPLKLDGTVPLRNAAQHVKAEAAGSLVILTLKGGPEIKHNTGDARGGKKRQILPTRKIPAPMIKAIKTVLISHFRDEVEK